MIWKSYKLSRYLKNPWDMVENRLVKSILLLHTNFQKYNITFKLVVKHFSIKSLTSMPLYDWAFHRADW